MKSFFFRGLANVADSAAVVPRLMCAVFAIAMMCATAQAGEFFHQPLAYTHELTPGFGFRHAFYSDSSDHLIRGLDRAGLIYRYGINDDVAIGGAVSYSAFTTYAEKAQGFEPIALSADLRADGLRYGVSASLGLEKGEVHKFEGNRSVGDPVSRYGAGGLRVTPYVGFQSGLFGAKLSGDVVDSDTQLTTGGVITGRNQLEASLFVEGPCGNDTLGAAVQYDLFESVTATNAPAYGAHSLLGFRLWAGMPYDRVVFLPGLSWQGRLSGDFTETTDIHLTFAGRFTF